MEALADYDSSGGEAADSAPIAYKKDFSLAVNAAPTVLDLGVHKTAPLLPGQNVLAANPTYSELWERPVAGPVQEGDKQARLQNSASNNVLTGHIETAGIEPFHFTEQMNTFQAMGYVHDPSGAGLVGDLKEAEKRGGISASFKKEKKKVRKEARGDPGEIDGYQGPWAPPEGEKDAPVIQMTPEQKEEWEKNGKKSKRRRMQEKREADKKAAEEEPQDKTIFHLSEEKDFQGRTFVDEPSDLHPNDKECFVPKRVLHEYRGHTKGVNMIQFFPKTGHLLLSASMDGKVKIWDVHSHRKVCRTYLGHSKAVKAVDFSNDGRHFLSASMDQRVKLWDTETGQVISTFSGTKMPNCVKFHPNNDKQSEFLTGNSDKKVYQWDIRKGEWVQEYDYHMGAVNAVLFCDEGRRFVSSADDKKLFIWEYGLAAPMKWIQEPFMHSMPSLCHHPTKKIMLCQSMDNQIVMYDTEKFRLDRKRLFRGHTCAGFGIQVNTSRDGKYVMSGDADGSIWFWDFKTKRVVKRLIRAHDKVSMGCVWHPIHTSDVATCGWDGVIKLWTASDGAR